MNSAMGYIMVNSEAKMLKEFINKIFKTLIIDIRNCHNVIDCIPEAPDTRNSVN